MIRVERDYLDRETRRRIPHPAPRIVLTTFTEKGRTRDEVLTSSEALALASEAIAAIQAVSR